MKIYYAGSIRGGRDDKDMYAKIIKTLSSYGEVLTEHVGDRNLTALGEGGPTEEYIYNRDMKWLKEADVLIAEVTTPSLGVGYEIAKAEEWGKKVLCLYRETEGKRLSAMILGCKKLGVKKYTSSVDLPAIFVEFFG
jgi:nucleoside 2-deoxyribosyltransferase